MGDIHSHSPITWPPSMCLSSHIVSGKSHAMHHMNRKSSVWETWTTQMASECAVYPARSGCTGLPKTGQPYGALYRETDTAERVQSCCMYIFHLSFGFQVSLSSIAEHWSNNVTCVWYTQRVPDMPHSSSRCSAVKLHMCLSVTSRCQPDRWERLCWTSDHMLCQGLQWISSHMMQENGLYIKRVQKEASRMIREMENPSHEKGLSTWINRCRPIWAPLRLGGLMLSQNPYRQN